MCDDLAYIPQHCKVAFGVDRDAGDDSDGPLPLYKKTGERRHTIGAKRAKPPGNRHFFAVTSVTDRQIFFEPWFYRCRSLFFAGAFIVTTPTLSRQRSSKARSGLWRGEGHVFTRLLTCENAYIAPNIFAVFSFCGAGHIGLPV
jgi:hypothetical protein